MQTGDPEADVIVRDHFGRPIPMDKWDFNFINYQKGESPQGLMGCYLCVNPIDIGPEPE